MKMLLVVDVINGFVNEGAMSDPSFNKKVPNIVALVEDYIDKGHDIVAFRDCHAEDAAEFVAYPQHCIKGTAESELIPELIPYQEHFIDIEKNSTNGYTTEKFQDYLKNNELEEIVIVGFCTDICVLQAALSTITHLFEHNKTTKVKIVKDAVDTFDGPDHDRDYYNQASFDLMENASAELVESHQELL